MASGAMFLVLIVLGLFAFLAFRQKKEKEDVSSAAGAGAGYHKPSFHAVEVRSSSQACPAAQSFRGKRFLSSEAPLIPLPACTSAKCACVYVHYDDRRSQQRRDVFLHGAYRKGERKLERRRETGRRFTDRMLNMGH